MTYAEFCEWVAFYVEHPFDDVHRYHRPAALIAQSMAGGQMDEKLAWLKGGRPLVEADEDSWAGRFSYADRRTFEALGMKLAGA